jgi:hypothetical protein
MEKNTDKVHGNGAEIPEKEDRTATDSGGIYDTENHQRTHTQPSTHSQKYARSN